MQELEFGKDPGIGLRLALALHQKKSTTLITNLSIFQK
jgi:hypothetical protein